MPKMQENFEKLRSGDVYRSLVSSLFSDIKVLIIGIVGTTFAIGVTAVAADSAVLWAIAAAYLLIGMVRIAINLGFMKAQSAGELTDKQARYWETLFSGGVCAHAFNTGLWVFATCWIESPIGQSTSLAVTFGSLIGVCCRSYPFKRLVTLQVMFVFLPMMAGLISLGSYNMVLGALLALYMTSIRNIAGILRGVLLDNIFQRKRAEANAERFDSALNNLPHGVCMFDSNKVLEVTNDLVVQDFSIPRSDLIGLSVTDIVALLCRDYGVSDEDGGVLLKWANSSGAVHLDHTFELGSDNRRSIRCCANPTSTGGFLVTLEDVTKELKIERDVYNMRRFDSLTGLYNRLYFTSKFDGMLKEAMDDNASALLLVNLNRFKRVNDALGHRMGDLMLCAAAERIENICGEVGIVSRYGGNEFAIALTGADARDLSTMIADTLISALDKPYDVEGRVAHLGVCIGIARVENETASASLLIDRASLALDVAKRRSDSQAILYHEGMGQEARERRALENDLRSSLAQGEMEAHFQPLVSIEKQKVSTFEALMRWNHPTLGFVSPGQFVPIAEDIGMISDLGAWMLEESCRICKSWPNNTRVAVNLSPLQFNEGNIVETVRNTLLKTGLAPSRLELEITESLMLENIDETIETLEQFKAMGVRISLDDFGTGYSCLSYLNKLPLDKVKIDRSFVTGIEPNTKASTLVKAVSGLGRQLGLSVVVEGVETERELKVLLESAQVDEIQGYLFSKPVTALNTVAMFDKNGEMQNRIVECLQPIRPVDISIVA